MVWTEPRISVVATAAPSSQLRYYYVQRRQCRFLRLPERFPTDRDDFDAARALGALPDFVVVDRCPVVFFPFRAERAPVLRCGALDFVLRPLLEAVFEIALVRFITLRTVRLAAGTMGCPFSAALPTTAPTTPPTTAPIGPATLPAAAPATAPAVCFRIGGIWMFLDDCEFSSVLAFEFLGMTWSSLTSSS